MNISSKVINKGNSKHNIPYTGLLFIKDYITKLLSAHIPINTDTSITGEALTTIYELYY